MEQDYRYLLDYARVFALASTKADDEQTMTTFVDVAHTILDDEMDLHREFAAEEHQYSPFIEKYTSDEFYESVGWMRDLVDRCAERYPGEREAMRDTVVRDSLPP